MNEAETLLHSADEPMTRALTVGEVEQIAGYFGVDVRDLLNALHYH
jgi:hypothetical protein